MEFHTVGCDNSHTEMEKISNIISLVLSLSTALLLPQLAVKIRHTGLDVKYSGQQRNGSWESSQMMKKSENIV